MQNNSHLVLASEQTADRSGCGAARRRALALSSAVAFSFALAAQGAIWDGNGDSNASGNWSTQVNWDTDLVPGAADTATLPAVTSGGTRTVAQDILAGTAIDTLILEQDNADHVNKLSLSGDLTLNRASSSALSSAMQVDLSGGATTAHVVVDLNGHEIVIASPINNTGAGTRLDATLNFNSAGSAVRTPSSGHTAYSIGGVMNVTADGALSKASGTGNFFQVFESGSALNIDGAVFSIVAGNVGSSTQNRGVHVTNNGAFDIKADGVLSIRVTSTATTARANARLNVGATGTVAHAGTIELKDKPHVDSTQELNNGGLWSIAGGSAVVKRLNSSPSVFHMPVFTNEAAGVLTGSGASDALEFDEEAGPVTPNRMSLINDGTLAPGAGSGGVGLASVGTLSLRDIELTLGATGVVKLDFGGSGAGEFDRVVLETGVNTPVGAGNLDLSAIGDTLELSSVNGFAPAGAFSVALLSAGSVVGEFDNVTLDAAAFTANSLVVPEGTYTVSYTSTTVDLSFVPIPEPGAMGALSAMALRVLARRRRR